MKHLIIILLALFTASFLTFCSDDDGNGKLDPDAKIYINGVDHIGNKNLYYNVDGKMTAHEVCCLDSLAMKWGLFRIDCENYLSIDTINDRLVFVAGNLTTIEDNVLLNVDVEPRIYFQRLKGFDEGFPDGELAIYATDTVAYIPRANRQAAYEEIYALWEKEDWNKLYEIFENALQFVPTTGAEYQALIDAGIE